MVTGNDGIFTFEVNCYAQQVYLMLDGRRMIPMHATDSDAWQLKLRLSTGPHRFRYYIDDGHSIERFVPAEPQCQRVEGRDAVLVVDEVTAHAEDYGAVLRF